MRGELGIEDQFRGKFPGVAPPSVRAGLVRAEFPVRGFSMAPDGKSFLTSLYRESSDIWMLEGFDAGPSLWRKLLPWS